MRGIKRIAVFGILAFSAAAVPSPAQTEGDLREYFEGRHVVILVDMPADEDGIDVQADKGRSINRGDVSKNLQRWGAALRHGDPAEITLVKKKGKHIEFQLNGGGWQGGRRAFLRYTPAPKSERHQDIEAELLLLPDPSDDAIPNERKQLRLRRILEEDLEELVRQYDAVNAERMAEAQKTQAREQADLTRRILAAGSRFNLRFDRDVPPEALTPEGLMDVLEKYVDFSQEAVNAAYARQRQMPSEEVEEQGPDTEPPEQHLEPASAEEILNNLRKGLPYEDALKLLGNPSRENRYDEGNLQVKACTFDGTSLGIIDTEFVEDVMVRYRISSR